MSIKTKFLSTIIGILLLVGLVMGFVIYWQNSRKLAEHNDADIKNTINYTFQLVNFYFGRAEDNLTNLAEDPTIIEALETKDPEKFYQASEKLTVANETLGTIDSISLYEINGSNCINRASDMLSSSEIGRDFSDQDYCKEIIKTKKLYFSPASPILGSPAMGLAIPVKNANNEMIGYVLGMINLSELRGYLAGLQEDSSVILLDRYGAKFLDTEEELKTPKNLPPTLVSKIQERLSNNENEGYFHDNNSFIGYKFNGSVAVVFEKSTASLLAATNELNLTIFFVLTAAMIFMIIVMSLLIDKITKRISRLSQIAQQISGGKFDFELNEKDLQANDEIAVLAKAFNEMTDRLTNVYNDMEEKIKQRTEELEEKNMKMEKSEAESKKALKNSERANKLMVGRELRMQELKLEIISLKNNLKKYE